MSGSLLLALYSISRVCTRLLNLLIVTRFDCLRDVVAHNLGITLFVKHIMNSGNINCVFVITDIKLS